MRAKLKHLELIEMPINSFKGWAVTTAAGLSFEAMNNKELVAAAAVASTLLFWGLDGHYQELADQTTVRSKPRTPVQHIDQIGVS